MTSKSKCVFELPQCRVESHLATPCLLTEAAAKAGVFLNALISFLIVAFVLFLVVRSVNRLFAKAEAPAAPAAPPEDIALLREIRDLLKQKS